MNKLIIADDEGKTTVVPLVRDEITIGRKEGNTIRLTERNVSRRHARLVRSNGLFTLEDLESYNGVRVNGEPIANPRHVNDGDRITIGDYQLSLRSDRPMAGPKMGAPVYVEPPPYARLVMMGPPNPGQEFSLEEGESVVGRTDENAIVINHRSISRSHSKVVVTEGICRLIDLDSANGVRVNGDDFTDIELTSGDLVELGTVRLRFVGPREDYQFDADATVQMDAVPEDILEELEGKRSLIPILVGVALLALVGLGVALFILLSGNGGDDIEPVVRPVENPTPSISPDNVKKQARDLMEQELWSAAMNALNKLGPAIDEEGQGLRLAAATEQGNQQVWKQACEDADPDDLSSIHAACTRIKKVGDDHSVYLGRECCQNSGKRFGDEQNTRAKKLMTEEEYAGALAVVKNTIADSTLPPEVRQIAEDIEQRAEEAQQAQTYVAPPPTRPVKGKRVEVRPPHKTPDHPIKKQAPTGSGTTALEQAKQAVLRGDQAGCIRALQGAPRTGSVVRALWYCYYNSGNIPQACNLGKSYERFLNPHQKQAVMARCR